MNKQWHGLCQVIPTFGQDSANSTTYHCSLYNNQQIKFLWRVLCSHRMQSSMWFSKKFISGSISVELAALGLTFFVCKNGLLCEWKKVIPNVHNQNEYFLPAKLPAWHSFEVFLLPSRSLFALTAAAPAVIMKTGPNLFRWLLDKEHVDRYESLKMMCYLHNRTQHRHRDVVHHGLCRSHWDRCLAVIHH